MQTAKSLAILGALVATSFLVGCKAPQMTWAEIFEQPARPTELDALNQFVGTWQQTARMTSKAVDEPYEGSGVGTAAWDADGWALVWHFDYNAPDGAMMRGTETWTWDDKAGKYRIRVVDNFGWVMTGTATYDPETRTFKTKSKGRSTLEGTRTTGSGTMRFIDDDTVEWDYTMWDRWHLFKMMEMSGTMTRN